ncbi:MAG: nucleoside hydrolase [Chloroflexota bacterium]|nr:nucleoside hydrolase [Chloroflexota bacterium]
MVTFPKLTTEERESLLEPPRGQASIILDTDTYNEIDDQFALVYALLSDNLEIKGVHAAPFHNVRSSGPADGMEKSYQEILHILEMMEYADTIPALRGSTTYLPSHIEPVPSPAAERLAEEALSHEDEPLYVLTIGAITNVASALLMEPEIIRHIVIVWLGGQPYYWPTAKEFNLRQDVPAAQVVFDSGVPLVHIPCKNVAEHLRTTLPEMQAYVRGQGAVGDYLYQIFKDHREDHFAHSKVIWDVSTVAYMNEPQWVPTALRPSPVLLDDVTWGEADATRHRIRAAYDVDRDAIFRDLFCKLAEQAE